MKMYKNITKGFTPFLEITSSSILAVRWQETGVLSPFVLIAATAG